jgi:hypothetical protein
VHALEHELDTLGAGRGVAAVEAREYIVVELAVPPAGALDRRARRRTVDRLVSQPVVALQAAGMDDGVRRAAPVAAELLGLILFDEARGNGACAVRTPNRDRGGRVPAGRIARRFTPPAADRSADVDLALLVGRCQFPLQQGSSV